MPEENPAPAQWKRPLAIFFAALAVRLFYLWESADGPFFETPLSDSATYHFLAQQLLRGDLDWRYFFQGVFYPTFLAGVYALVGPSVVAVKILQAVMGAFTALLTERLGTRVGGGLVGWIAGGTVALYGPSVFFDGELLAAGWGAFFAAALLLLLLRAAERPNLKRFLLLGIIGGLSVLNRAVFLPFLVLAVAWLFRTVRSNGRAKLLRYAAAVCLGIALFSAPVATVNYQHTHHFSFLPSSGGLNLYLGNNETSCDTLTIRPGEKWQNLVNEPVRHGIVQGADKEAYFTDKFFDYLKDDPAGYIVGLGAKLLRLINGREIPRNVDIYLQRDRSTYLFAAVWKLGRFGFPFSLLFALAAVGFTRRQSPRLPTPFLLFAGLYGLSIMLVFVTARYRIPLIPALSVAAALGVRSGIDAVKARNRSVLGLNAAIFSFALLLSVVPPTFCEESIDLEPELYFVAGNSAVQDNRIEQAVAFFEQATALNPRYFEAFQMLGLALQQKGRLKEASDAFKTAVKIQPESMEVRLFLGKLSVRLGRFEDAEKALTPVVKTKPRHVESRFLLAVALSRLGKLQEAREHLKIAAQIAPDTPAVRRQLSEVEAKLGDSSERGR